MPVRYDKTKSDGCTMWPDGDWNSCCVTHDEAYWYGGTWKDRFKANYKLASCVGRSGGTKGGLFRRIASTAGHRLMAPVMFIGTQAFGCFLWPYHLTWNKKDARNKK